MAQFLRCHSYAMLHVCNEKDRTLRSSRAERQPSHTTRNVRQETNDYLPNVFYIFCPKLNFVVCTILEAIKEEAICRSRRANAFQEALKGKNPLSIQPKIKLN